jgi:hypothetical protein
MLAKHLLSFMKRKLRTCPEVIWLTLLTFLPFVLDVLIDIFNRMLSSNRISHWKVFSTKSAYRSNISLSIPLMLMYNKQTIAQYFSVFSKKQKKESTKRELIFVLSNIGRRNVSTLRRVNIQSEAIWFIWTSNDFSQSHILLLTKCFIQYDNSCEW